MKSILILSLVVLTLAACAEQPSAPTPQAPPSATAITTWNERLLALAEEEDGFLTLKGLRTAAMMHLAMHDTLSAIYGRYQPYLDQSPALDPALDPPTGAAPLAAIAQAAYEVAADQYPDQKDLLQADLETCLARTADDGKEGSSAILQGIALGKAVAGAVLAFRSGDGWDAEAEYQWHPMGPGVYAEFEEHSGTPKGFIFGAGWAKATPFMLESPGHFRSPPPPPIDSEAYTRAFQEVKELGRFESPARTGDQTHLALWWKDFVENSHNRLARQLATTEDLDAVDAARLFALLQMSVYDAYINVFDNKFLYNHWRPYTAIRWAAEDGNPATEADETWTNTHRHTYAFPSYPSAHGTACAAAMTVLADAFGEDRPFTMITQEVDQAGPFSGKIPMNPPSRSFPDFASAAMECSLSRVYLGIHFRYDSVEGNKLGQRIGTYAVESFLRPAEG